jgi:hypothetical protein
VLRRIAISLCLSSGALACDRPVNPAPGPVATAPASPDAHDTAPAVRADDPSRAVLRDADASIAEFWRWWAGLSAAQRLTTATRPDGPLFDAMSEHVRAIAPAMAFEFGPGVTSEHALALSGEGDAVLRLIAERWRRAGPGNDATWSFHTARQAIATHELLGSTLRFEGIDVPLKDVRVDVRRPDDDPTRLDIGLWHPALAKLTDETRTMASFVVLDQAIGEDATLAWISSVSVVTDPPKPGHDLAGLAGEVAALAKATPEGTYTLGKATHPTTGDPIIVRMHVAARRWAHPFHDTLCTVTIPYASAHRGLPDALMLDAIDARETVVTELLGAQAVHFGTVTGAGSRRIWFYVDGDTDAVTRVDRWAATLEPPARVESSFDPEWDKAAPW